MVLQVLHHSECAETLHAYKCERDGSVLLCKQGTSGTK